MLATHVDIHFRKYFQSSCYSKKTSQHTDCPHTGWSLSINGNFLIPSLRHYFIPVYMLMYLILKQQSSNYNSAVSRKKLVYLFLFLPVPTRLQCLLRHKLQVSGTFPLVCTNHANKPFPISYSKPTWDLKDCISGPFFTMFFVGFPGDFQRAI